MEWLDQLPLSQEEKELIKSLETHTPASLYGLIRLTPVAFEKYFGKERTWHLVRFLYPLLSSEDEKLLLPTSVGNEQRFELFHARDKIKKLMNK